MSLATVGRNYYPGYNHPLWINPNEEQPISGQHPECYRLILLLEGAGFCEIMGATQPIIGPAFYCLNEQESIRLLPGSYMRTKTVYFLPSLINAQFTFKMDPLTVKSFSILNHQELWYLEPFRNRMLNANQQEILTYPIEPSLTAHAEALYEKLNVQLNEQPDPQWPCRSRSALIELIALARPHTDLNTAYQPELGSPDDPIQPIILYLHMNYKLKIRVEDLTRLFHTNKTTLNMQFKHSTGLSIKTYLNNIRMQTASSLLSNTQLPTDEIKQSIGFLDNAHFSRTFRKHTGCSPVEYRNLHGK
jgi:AraC-like DNA-binding protein